MAWRDFEVRYDREKVLLVEIGYNLCHQRAPLPDTATGLISALTVGTIATQGTADFNTLTSTLAVLIGIFSFHLELCAWGGWQGPSLRT